MAKKTGRIYANKNKTLELWGYTRTKMYYTEWFTHGINKTRRGVGGQCQITRIQKN